MRLEALAVINAIAFAAGFSASAHHSFSMFDATKLETKRGTVERYLWSFPHTHIAVDIPASGSRPASTWTFESSSPNILVRQGWTRNTFKPGDAITVVYNPVRDGSNAGAVYYAIGSDGKKLFKDPTRLGGPADQNPP